MTNQEKKDALVLDIMFRLSTRYLPGSSLRRELDAALAKNLSLHTLEQLRVVVMSRTDRGSP